MKHLPLISISTERFLIAAFILCIGCSLLIYQQVDRQHRRADQVTHGYMVRTTLSQLLFHLAEAETNQRSYLLTHDIDFLERYRAAVRKSRILLSIVDSLTANDAFQQEQLNQLQYQFNGKVAEQRPFDQLRLTAHSMLDAEDRQLQQRLLEKANSAKTGPYLWLIVFLGFTGLGYLGYRKMKKETGRRMDSDEQRATQQAIFQQAETTARIGSYTWNAATGEMALSDNLYRLLGYEPHDGLAMPEMLLQLVHPADRHRVLHNGRTTLEKMIQSESPCRFVTRDGIIKWLNVTGSPVYRPEGELFVGTFQDVTRDVELRAELENNDRFIRSLLHVAPSIITIFDTASQSIVFSSRRHLSFPGRMPEVPFSPDSLSGMVHPEDRERTRRHFQEMGQLPDTEMSELEYRVWGQDQRYHHLLTRSTPYKRDEEGAVTQFISATIDISEKVRAEQELKARNEALLISTYEERNASRFQVLADSMPQIVWTARPTGEITYFNQRWYEVMPPRDDLPVRLQLEENIHPDDREKYFTQWGFSLRTGSPFQVEFRFKERWYLAKALPLRGPEDAVLAWHGTFTDVNDQKLAQLAIERLAKEKEDFIGIAGRELKTPVTILKGSIQLLEREAKGFELSPELSNLIRMAGRQAGRLSRMVSDLLDVARLDAERIRLPKSDFLLREVIEESIEQVNHPGRRETIRVTGWTDIPVHANKERIGQVVMNFLSNAIKYSNEGSEVTITVTREEGYVRLAVEDRGVGIPKERLAFVFDRTFRVDESEKTASGLGLGLYVSAEIIALHQGEIGVNSEPGQGSVFWFRLPA